MIQLYFIPTPTCQVALSIHAARRLGLRRRVGDDPGGSHDRRAEAEGARPLRQERLCLHDRPRDGRGAGREALRGGELGQGR